MIKKIKYITIFISLIFLFGCGYSPLLQKEKIQFYIADLELNGDRQINNSISKNIKKYQNYLENKEPYKVYIESDYIRSVVNKDRSGNPKNYKVTIKINLIVINSKGKEVNKSFERFSSFSAQNKRVAEKELENKYKSDLSNLISKDIISFIINQ